MIAYIPLFSVNPCSDFPVYQLKYKNRQEYARILSEAAAYAVREIILNKYPVEMIISVPPSKSDRDKQPVIRIAEAISGILDIEFNDSMIRKTMENKYRNVTVYCINKPGNNIDRLKTIPVF